MFVVCFRGQTVCRLVPFRHIHCPFFFFGFQSLLSERIVHFEFLKELKLKFVPYNTNKYIQGMILWN